MAAYSLAAGPRWTMSFAMLRSAPFVDRFRRAIPDRPGTRGPGMSLTRAAATS
jgi:hypothetical protein